MFGIIMLFGLSVFAYHSNKRIIYLEEKMVNLSKEQSNLKKELAILSKTINSYHNDEAERFKLSCTKEKYNFLVLGNSITKHGKCDYWWGEYGMAATKEERDYVHQLSQMFVSGGVKPNYYALNFAQWEQLNNDRAQAIGLIRPWVNSNLDLIIIQLGENVSSLDTFEADLDELLVNIKQQATKAEIVLVGDFWINEKRNNIKREIADRQNLIFIDLAEIADNKDYMCGLNASVMGDDGNNHIVQHNGVANHPNDIAMLYIAKRIIKELNPVHK